MFFQVRLPEATRTSGADCAAVDSQYAKITTEEECKEAAAALDLEYKRFYYNRKGGTKPRNPRNFDGIRGGRKCVSRHFIDKNSVWWRSTTIVSCTFWRQNTFWDFLGHFWAPPLMKAGYGARSKLSHLYFLHPETRVGRHYFS